MREKQQTFKMTEETVSVRCNRCGDRYGSHPEQQGNADMMNEIHMQACEEFTIHWGYGSKFDTQKWKFDLCDKCVEVIAKDFIIPPEIEDYF